MSASPQQGLAAAERISELARQREKLLVARRDLRNDNRTLRDENAALRAELEARVPPPAPDDESLWEAYSAGLQNGLDHLVAGEPVNWFAARGDFEAWREQTS